MSQTVAAGSDVTLRCLINIDSSPPPSASWTFTSAAGDKKPVALNAITSFLVDKDQQLVLMNIEERNGGDYACTASNQFGQQTANAVVRILPG